MLLDNLAMEKTVLILLSLGLMPFSCRAFYLQVKPPTTYCMNKTTRDCHKEVNIYANRLLSFQSAMTYKHDRFDFCQTEYEKDVDAGNLGQTLSGDRIQRTPIKLKYLKDVQCQEVCNKTYTAGDNAQEKRLNFIKYALSLDYYHQWIVDDVPVTWCYATATEDRYCTMNFPLGCFVDSKGKQNNACIISRTLNQWNMFYVFNHLDITINYHSDESVNSGRIVSAHVEPSNTGNRCRNQNQVQGIPGGKLTQNITISYTYSVKWKRTDIVWSSRWDYILKDVKGDILLFSTLNSVIITLFMTLLLGRLLLQVHNKCICKRTVVEKQWKTIHGYVFLPPRNGMMLCVFLGSGLQIFLAVFFTIVAGSIGLVSAASPGSVMQACLILFDVMGAPAGYMSARFYKTFGGCRPVLHTTVLFIFSPGISLLVFLIMDSVHRGMGSSGAIPGHAFFGLIGFWSVSAFSICAGSYIGFKIGAKPFPCKTVEDEKLPDIPRKSIVQRLTCTSGILAFGMLFVHSFFILNSIWFDQVYNMYGFLLAGLTLTALTTFAVAIFVSYVELYKKNYKWWWAGFWSAMGVGVCIFIYSLWYFFRKVDIKDNMSVFIFIGYSFLAGFLAFLAIGALGFLASFWFVVYIYSVLQKEIDEDNNDDYGPLEKKTVI